VIYEKIRRLMVNDYHYRPWRFGSSGKRRKHAGISFIYLLRSLVGF